MNGILGYKTVFNELEALNVFFVVYKRLFNISTANHAVDG